MNIKKLTDGLIENWPQKIICIVLAIVLYVFNRVSSLEKKVFTVPLKVEASGLMMPASELPRYIKVTIRTKAENMPSINSSSVFASVNLDEYTECGKYRIPVSISMSESLMLLDPLEYSAKPDSLEIELDTKELAYIPIKAAISGEVEHGYTISNIDISPSTVKVLGPAKMIEKTKFINTRKVIVSNAAKNFSQEVKLDNINSKLRVIPESDFRVTVTVIPATDSKTFSEIIPSVVNLSEGLSIDSEIPSVSIKLTGSVNGLEKLELSQDALYLDFKNISEAGTYDLPLNFSIPKSFAIVEKSLESVNISLVKKEVEEESSENPETIDLPKENVEEKEAE